MDNIAETSQENDVQLWEGFIYLSFFIFANLFVLPNMPEQVRFHYYPVEMLIYGTIGIFSGIAVYRIVKDSAEWLKITIVSVLYGLILIRLIIHWELFTVMGN
ncbi:MAG: hypothetical protein H7X71_00150 [Chitinophagales bacterium]|nr:hypothetical protein [Chitinophagales bacterium]